MVGCCESRLSALWQPDVPPLPAPAAGTAQGLDASPHPGPPPLTTIVGDGRIDSGVEDEQLLEAVLGLGAQQGGARLVLLELLVLQVAAGQLGGAAAVQRQQLWER